MKRHSTFHILALLTAALVFSTPLVTLAQQNAEVPASKTTTEVEKLGVIEAAKADAKSDLDNTQRILWFLGGVGCGVCTVGAAAVSNPKPPTHRLLGKSPEYVAIYANTYTKQMRTSRFGLASAGCLVSTALYGLIILNDSSSYSGSGSGCTSSDFELFSSSSSGCN